MITSIFNKSKPINYISVFVLNVLAFVLMLFKYKFSDEIDLAYPQLLVNFLVLFLSLFTLNFIVQKNSLAKDNNFTTLGFSLFILLFPQIFISSKLLLCNLLLLLAFRRLVSLYSQRNTVKKLLDSGIFIALASLLNVWLVWFMLLPFIALIYHSEKIISYWLIPILGFASIVLLAYTFGLCFPEIYMFSFDGFYFSLNFSNYNNWPTLVSIGFILSLLVWSLLFYVPSISKRKRILWPAYKLIPVFLVIALAIIVLQPVKTGCEFLFFAMPFAIICANYFQTNTPNWIKDAIFSVWLILILLFTVITW